MTLDEATILIVDDEPILQEVCALWLKQGGCQQVLTASNGVEALALLEEQGVDLLITESGEKHWKVRTASRGFIASTH